MFLSFDSPQHDLASLQRVTIIDDYYSDSSDSREEDDEDDLRPSLDIDLAHIQKSITKYLNLTNSYVRSWGCEEAFRETYQNW